MRRNISLFAQEDTSKEMVKAALTYECFGYYNAIEHLIVRFLKHLRIEVPTGQFSHRDTLRSFYQVASDKGLEIDLRTTTVINNLMAFRHVATKIYSFLIDWNKLKTIIDDIQENHENIKQLFVRFLHHLSA